MRQKQFLIRFLSVGISLILLAYVLTLIDFQSLPGLIERIPVIDLVLALLIHLCLNFFRAVRFRWLNRQSIPLKLLYPITLYHDFFVRFLPFKTGEAMYPILLRRYTGQSITEGISSLLISRAFELVLITFFGGLGLFLSVPQNHNLGIIALAIAPAMFLGMYFAGSILGYLIEVGDKLGRRRNVYFVAQMQRWLGQLANGFDQLHESRVLVAAIMTSACTYSLSLLFELVLLRGLGVDVNLGILVATISLGMIAEALPIASFSGFGVVEGGWVFALTQLAGLAPAEAASISLVLHVCALCSAAISGLFGYVTLRTLGRIGKSVTANAATGT